MHFLKNNYLSSVMMMQKWQKTIEYIFFLWYNSAFRLCFITVWGPISSRTFVTFFFVFFQVVPPYHRGQQCLQGQGEPEKLPRPGARVWFTSFVTQRTRRLGLEIGCRLGRFARSARRQEGSAGRQVAVFPRALHLQHGAAPGEATFIAARRSCRSGYLCQ